MVGRLTEKMRFSASTEKLVKQVESEGVKDERADEYA